MQLEEMDKFKLFKKKLNVLYKDENSLNNITQHSASFGQNSINNLKNILENSPNDATKAAAVSRKLQAIDSNYAKILSYYKDMFYIRYTVTPVQIEDGDVDSEIYLKKYKEMLEVVDGINMETVIPMILEQVVASGASYIYAQKHTTSRTLSIIQLPTSYCRTVLKTNFGTSIIEFNFRYFDQFRDSVKDEIFSYFPKEFKTLYNVYKNGGGEWQRLNPNRSTSLMLNEYGMPQFLSALYGISEYENAIERERERNENQLTSILTHRIPLKSDGDLIFDIDEVKEIHKKMTAIAKKHKGLEVVTVFGDSELLKLQKEDVENKQVYQTYQEIFNNAGMNASPFVADDEDSLAAMRAIDQAMIWRLIVSINQFINLAVNNLYNFKPFQVEINILPITVANEIEQVKMYRENASFGLGKIEALVATGIKQKYLTDKYRLEKELKIDQILTPLHSAHTQSSTSVNDEVNTDEE